MLKTEARRHHLASIVRLSISVVSSTSTGVSSLVGLGNFEISKVSKVDNLTHSGTAYRRIAPRNA